MCLSLSQCEIEIKKVALKFSFALPKRCIAIYGEEFVKKTDSALNLFSDTKNAILNSIKKIKEADKGLNPDDSPVVHGIIAALGETINDIHKNYDKDCGKIFEDNPMIPDSIKFIQKLMVPVYDCMSRFKTIAEQYKLEKQQDSLITVYDNCVTRVREIEDDLDQQINYYIETIPNASKVELSHFSVELIPKGGKQSLYVKTGVELQKRVICDFNNNNSSIDQSHAVIELMIPKDLINRRTTPIVEGVAGKRVSLTENIKETNIIDWYDLPNRIYMNPAPTLEWTANERFSFSGTNAISLDTQTMINRISEIAKESNTFTITQCNLNMYNGNIDIKVTMELDAAERLILL